jgi:hypothetical protein
MTRSIPYLLLLVLLAAMARSGASPDAWTDFPEEFDAAAINEGELEFLATPPLEPVHTHDNRIDLTAASLEDGWAGLHQCHVHLDPVPAAQIVFRPGRIRQLQVERHSGIGSVRVEGHTVQLEGVTPGAELCLSAESRILVSQPGGGFLVRNGPFMRSFLDGYYPMNVRLEISLPSGDWALVRSDPVAQPGFRVAEARGKVSVDAWFSGKLHTAFYFEPGRGPVTD